MEHFFILGLILLALVLFAMEVVRPDIVALGVAMVLLLTGTVSIEVGFSGFSNPAVITVIAMFILSEGIVKTGITDKIAGYLIRLGGDNPVILTVLVMLTVGVMSAFMNNIGATAVLLTAVYAISQKTGYPASKLLIPLSFGSLLGGLTTLIGTPPNLLVSMAMEDAGFEGFKMFDFFPTGSVILLAAIIYMAFIGRRIIPERKASGDYLNQYQLTDYLTEIFIKPNSSLAGKTLQQSDLAKEFEITVLQIHRMENNKEGVILPRHDTLLEENDHLIVEGNITRLLQFKDNNRFEISAERKFDDASLKGDNVVIAEVAIAPNANIIGQSIKRVDVRRRFGVLAMALRRQERVIAKYTNVLLDTGDVLLVQGTQEAIVRLAENPNFLVVNRLEHETRNTNKAPFALAIMFIIITAASTGILHISTAGFLGVLLMILTNCLKPQDIYRAVEWRVVFLIAFMMPLGIAMNDDHSGTARWLSNHIVGFAGDYGPYFLLACLFIFTTLITEVMSNAAAAVLIAPIGVSIALGMNLEPHPFMMAIAIGASTTFLTPIGHQANVLVYGVGGYRFTDFTKVGLPLNIIIFTVSMLIIPLVWPFVPLK